MEHIAHGLETKAEGQADSFRKGSGEASNNNTDFSTVVLAIVVSVSLNLFGL